MSKAMLLHVSKSMFYPPKDSVAQNGPSCFWAAQLNFGFFRFFFNVQGFTGVQRHANF